MKKIILLTLLSCSSYIVFAQDQRDKDGNLFTFKYLLSNGIERRVVYFINADNFYFCGQDPNVRRRRIGTESFRPIPCACLEELPYLLPVLASGNQVLLFNENSTAVTSTHYPVLDQLVALLNSNPTATVTLKGYTSSEGTVATNLGIAKDRANSAKSYLVSSGIAPSRVRTVGYGESNPVASNETEEGRIQNRRVEIKLN